MKTTFAIFGSVIALALCSSTQAQQLDNPATIPVTIYGEAIISTSPAEFHIAQGPQLPGLPVDGVWAQATGTGGTYFYSNVYTANLVPGVDYTITTAATNCAAVIAHFQVQNAVVYLGPLGTGLAKMDSICLGSNYTFSCESS